jgi:hypothetical protein
MAGRAGEPVSCAGADRPAPGFDQKALEQRLVSALEEAGAMRTEVVIEQVASLEQAAVGKTPLVRGLPRDGDEP